MTVISIKSVIQECCEKGKMPEYADQIEISFAGTGEAVRSKLLPNHTIIIDTTCLEVADEEDQIFAVKDHVCWLLACARFNKTVERYGDEWRYFSFATDTVQPLSKPPPAKTFELLSDW